MKNKLQEQTLQKIVYFGVPIISLIIITDILTDPVNLPKYLVLVTLGMGLFFVILSSEIKFLYQQQKTITFLIILFVLFSLNAVARSDSAISQNLYGVYGRNSGILTYFSLSVFLLATLCFRSELHFLKLLHGFFVTGVINVLYCGWVLVFGDFIPWNNEYGQILGFLGNPNFIGAFLGMFCTYIAALMFFGRNLRLWQKIALIILGILSLFEIQASKAVQGKVVAVVGISFVVYMYLKQLKRGNLLSLFFALFISCVGGFALAGALQKGPLAEIIYKRSVSLRGSYWDAGIAMGLNNPFSGVGMDSYIDWYRSLRSINAATRMPGPDIVTNAAHNVPIDFFSYGGFPLLIIYILIICLGFKSVFNLNRSQKKFQFASIAISALWIGYQVQSLVSINQIGLAIWGWVFTGALLALERLQRIENSKEFDVNQQEIKKNIRINGSLPKSHLLAGFGMVIGLIIALPPYTADLRWRSALVSQQLNNVEIALTPKLFNPPNSSKYLQAYQIFLDSGLPVQARKYTLDFLKFNPRSFEAWKCLYSLASSTPSEKQKALEMMKKLDPNNPDVTSTK